MNQTFDIRHFPSQAQFAEDARGDEARGGLIALIAGCAAKRLGLSWLDCPFTARADGVLWRRWLEGFDLEPRR